MTRVIAIDGPAASGKSSTSAAVATTIGAVHLDSGALYRGLTRVALDAGTRDPTAIEAAAERRQLELRADGGEIVVILDGEPAEPHIRSVDVTAAVSDVAALPSLREWVNARLRRAAVAAGHILVLDGRDIGTAVFPDAVLKVFLTATPEARAIRRLVQRGDPLDPASVAHEADALARRDAIDSTRSVAPLRQAADALLIDSTSLSFREQVDAIVIAARRKLGVEPAP